MVADFIDPPDGLGDGYRVEARVVIWEASEVLKVPGSATFRDRNGWSVFVVDRGRASQRTVQIGHRNQAEAEILGGIAAGEQVILYPSNQHQRRSCSNSFLKPIIFSLPDWRRLKFFGEGGGPRHPPLRRISKRFAEPGRVLCRVHMESGVGQLLNRKQFINCEDIRCHLVEFDV